MGDSLRRRGPAIALNPAVFPHIGSYLPFDKNLDGISCTGINIVNVLCRRETVFHGSALFLSLILD
jgi:hypothetical protein